MVGVEKTQRRIFFRPQIFGRLAVIFSLYAMANKKVSKARRDEFFLSQEEEMKHEKTWDEQEGEMKHEKT